MSDVACTVRREPHLDILLFLSKNLLSESPTLVVGKKRLKGRYKDVVGTDLMFDPIKESMSGFVGSNRRRLVFEDGGS